MSFSKDNNKVIDNIFNDLEITEDVTEEGNNLHDNKKSDFDFVNEMIINPYSTNNTIERDSYIIKLNFINVLMKQYIRGHENKQVSENGKLILIGDKLSKYVVAFKFTLDTLILNRNRNWNDIKTYLVNKFSILSYYFEKYYCDIEYGQYLYDKLEKLHNLLLNKLDEKI